VGESLSTSFLAAIAGETRAGDSASKAPHAKAMRENVGIAMLIPNP
jgi:hypothetical protein